ncbi:preprotein translocase subunit SecG [Candidatus Kaiserbacteria bacterium]|nr:MAG: preprotein translocase subunit SecG [Candidatus Kaiserbacteria bacterium]
MEIVRTILPYAQIILSIILIAAILLQQRGSSMGGAFGGDNFSATYHTRRGAELFLYRLSIVLAILFVASTFLSFII